MQKKEDILEASRKLVRDHVGRPFVMATVTPKGKPHVFWMGALVIEEPFTIYTETFKDSRKVTNIRANDSAELLFAAKDFSQVLTVTGKASMESSAEKKAAVFETVAESPDYFEGPDDPNFAVLRIDATQLRLFVSRDQREPMVADLEAPGES